MRIEINREKDPEYSKLSYIEQLILIAAIEVK